MRAGRMSGFTINGMAQASYVYDFAGRQAIRSLTPSVAATIHSVFDSEDRRIAEYDEATGALIREYVWLGWEPLAMIEGGAVYFVRADHIERPVFATNASGAKGAHRRASGRLLGPAPGRAGVVTLASRAALQV